MSVLISVSGAPLCRPWIGEQEWQMVGVGNQDLLDYRDRLTYPSSTLPHLLPPQPEPQRACPNRRCLRVSGQGSRFDALLEMGHALKLLPIGRLLDREFNDKTGFAHEASVEAGMLEWIPRGKHSALLVAGLLRTIASGGLEVCSRSFGTEHCLLGRSSASRRRAC